MSAPRTAGPWIVEETEDGHEIRMDTAISNRGFYDSHHIIEYKHGVEPDSDEPEAVLQYAEAEANAHLIAAAPEVVEAATRVLKVKADYQVWSSAGVARALLPYTESDLRRESEAAFSALAAAIAKASPPDKARA